MLHGLFGNRNVARILLFIFVNEKCYATQIQSLLQVPLTPIQRACLRLEKARILESHYEGKIRIFRFNSNYPLHAELEMLLKKMYTLLPPQEKKQYCFVHKSHYSLFAEQADRERLRSQALTSFWERLKGVESLSFSAQTRHNGESNFRRGRAEVHTVFSGGSIVFHERGHWMIDGLEETGFSNSFRWTFDRNLALITLEHLRYGIEHPVFLFHLTPTQPYILESVDAHLCGEDTYLGNIVWSRDKIDFHWRIIGAKKNDHLTYRYI